MFRSLFPIPKLGNEAMNLEAVAYSTHSATLMQSSVLSALKRRAHIEHQYSVEALCEALCEAALCEALCEASCETLCEAWVGHLLCNAVEGGVHRRYRRRRGGRASRAGR